MTLPTTPHSSATAKLICPLAAQYPAGGITSSLGTGRIDDSIAMSAMIPGYPRSSSVLSSQSIDCSSIEAVLADERNEAGGTDRCRSDALGGAAHEGERLCPPLRSQRDDDATTGSELLDQGRWHLGPSRGDEDRVVGSVGAPPQRAVAHEDGDVADGGGAQRCLSRFRQRAHSLDGKDLI